MSPYNVFRNRVYLQRSIAGQIAILIAWALLAFGYLVPTLAASPNPVLVFAGGAVAVASIVGIAGLATTTYAVYRFQIDWRE